MWQVNLLLLTQRFVELQHRAFCHYPTYHGVEQLSEKRQGRGQPAAAQGLPAAAHPGQGVRLTHGFFIGRRMRG